MALQTYLTGEPVFYGLLLVPSGFLVKRHGKHGYLGWGLVTLLCLMHIIGGAMQLTGARYGVSVLNGCPGILLLACCGIWWEVNHHLESLNMLAKIKVIATSLLTIAGTVLMIQPSTLISRPKIVIACGCWGIAWLAAFIQAIFSMKAQGFGFGKPHQKLLVAVTFGTVCAGVRIIFTIVVKTRLRYMSQSGAGIFTTAVILSFVLVPEALATLVLVVIGLMTRGICG